jgi:hypothetical protein
LSDRSVWASHRRTRVRSRGGQGPCDTSRVPSELKPLLAIVIALAIVHALLKVRARVPRAQRRGLAVKKAPIQLVAPSADAGTASTPEEALARLRERAMCAEAKQ